MDWIDWGFIIIIWFKVHLFGKIMWQVYIAFLMNIGKLLLIEKRNLLVKWSNTIHLSVIIGLFRLHLLLVLVIAVERPHKPVILKKLFTCLSLMVFFHESLTPSIPILLLKVINFAKHINRLTDQQRFFNMFPSLCFVLVNFTTSIETLVIFGCQIIFDGLWCSTL